MSKFEKLLRKIRDNPKQVSFDDLDLVLRHAGFERRQASGGTSHYFYSHPKGLVITVPRRKPHVLAVYVKRVIRLLNELDDLESEG